MAPLPAAVLAAIIGSAGSLAGGLAKAGAIAQQNAYNHPARQLARLRKAGLPFAAMSAGGAATGNASGDFGDLGLTETGGRLSQFLSNQQTQEAINLAKIQQDKDRADADVAMGTRDFLINGIGPDGKTANLATNLRYQQQGLGLGVKAQEIGNDAAKLALENLPTKIDLENQQARQSIANAMTLGEGMTLDNAMKELENFYYPKMRDSELATQLKQRKLLDENIEGADLDNRIKTIRANIEKQTEFDQIRQVKTGTLMKWLEYDKMKEYFSNYKDWYEFVQRTQDAFNKGPLEMSFSERLRAAAAFAYTSMTSATGQTGSLLNFLK